MRVSWVLTSGAHGDVVGSFPTADRRLVPRAWCGPTVQLREPEVERARTDSMIGICTDSNSLLPDELAQRFGVEVVPLTVRMQDHEYLEGVDLDVDAVHT